MGWTTFEATTTGSLVSGPLVFFFPTWESAGSTLLLTSKTQQRYTRSLPASYCKLEDETGDTLRITCSISSTYVSTKSKPQSHNTTSDPQASETCTELCRRPSASHASTCAPTIVHWSLAHGRHHPRSRREAGSANLQDHPEARRPSVCTTDQAAARRRRRGLPAWVRDGSRCPGREERGRAHE